MRARVRITAAAPKAFVRCVVSQFELDGVVLVVFKQPFDRLRKGWRDPAELSCDQRCELRVRADSFDDRFGDLVDGCNRRDFDDVGRRLLGIDAHPVLAIDGADVVEDEWNLRVVDGARIRIRGKGGVSRTSRIATRTSAIVSALRRQSRTSFS
jgi:hypothetical protein